MSNEDSIEAEDIFASTNNVPAAEESKQQEPAEEKEEPLDDEILAMSTAELRQRMRLLDNDIRIMQSDIQRIQHESHGQRERIRENVEKVKLNKQLPYLVGNVVEVLEPDAEDGKEDRRRDANGCKLVHDHKNHVWFQLIFILPIACCIGWNMMFTNVLY